MAPYLSDSWDGSLFDENRKLSKHQDKASKSFVTLCSLCQTLILTGWNISSWKQKEVIIKCPEEILKSFLNQIDNQVFQVD